MRALVLTIPLVAGCASAQDQALQQEAECLVQTFNAEAGSAHSPPPLRQWSLAGDRRGAAAVQDCRVWHIRISKENARPHTPRHELAHFLSYEVHGCLGGGHGPEWEAIFNRLQEYESCPQAVGEAA